MINEDRSDAEHVITVQRNYNADWWVTCSCEQKWRIPHMKQQYLMEAEVTETFNKHRAYFNRPKTRVD